MEVKLTEPICYCKR